MTPLLAVYLAGVVVGLLRTNGPVTTRLGYALLWPIGPLAFVVTVAGLLVVTLVALTGLGRSSRAGQVA